MPCCSLDKELPLSLLSLQTKSFLCTQYRKKRDERTLCPPHAIPCTKPVVYLGPKPATVHDLHYYLQHASTDTQLVGLSPLCASKLMDRDSIKPRLRLLFFRYAEHGHFLYFSNMRAEHGHSEEQCLGTDVLGKREKGSFKKGIL